MKIEFVGEDKLQEMFVRQIKGHKLPVGLLAYGTEAGGAQLELTRGRESGVQERLTSLLREKIPFISESIPDGAMVTCLGTVDSEKSLIIARTLASKRGCEFCVMDVNGRALDAVMTSLEGMEMKMSACVGFIDDLPRLRKDIAAPFVACYFGNGFCGWDPMKFLSSMRETLRPEDFLLFDCHLFEPGAQPGPGQEAALAAEQPARAAGLCGDSVVFREDVLPAATPAGQAYRTRNVMQVQKDFQLTADAGTVHLKKGDEIELGFTYKYTLSQVVTLLKRTRFQIVRLFLSDDNNDLIVLVKPREDDFLMSSVLER